ncbi:MAG: hypothetical protein KKF89_00895, partial [Nanoarchaeota archaeon]|nr:hypothetical protein [Nanoarchaeota archaeon]
MIERNEIKIILRVKLDSWKSHCKLICFGKTNEDYDVEFKRLQESLNLDEKVAIWDYRSARFTTASKEFLNNNKNIIGLIVITSGQDVNAVRKVKITRITHLSNEINVNFSFDDFVLIDKANLKRIMQLTMDEKEIFLGVGARGVNQMCHYIRDGETFTNELNKLIAGSQETISSKILNLYKFDKYGLGSKIQNK